jgi:DNA-binding transcriptional LysR family regulator
MSEMICSSCERAWHNDRRFVTPARSRAETTARASIPAFPFFARAITALANSNLILAIPRRLALPLSCQLPVRFVAAPPEIKGLNYEMIWHPRLNDDPAHHWFRQQVGEIGAGQLQSRTYRTWTSP